MIEHVSRGGRAVSSVLAIYRAPSGLVRDFLGDLEEHLSSLPSGSNSIVIGDLNIDINTNNYLDNNSTMYLDLIGQYGFYNTIFSPTRLGETKISLLDHILVNSTNKMKTCTIDSIITDHLPTVAFIALSKHFKNDKKQMNSSQFSVINYTALQNYIDEFDWSPIYAFTNPTDACNSFISNIQNLITKASKSKSINTERSIFNTFKKPWITTDLLKLIRKRSWMHNKA